MKTSLMRLMKEYSLYSDGKATFVARLTSVLLWSVLFVLCMVAIFYYVTEKLLFSVMIALILSLYLCIFVRTLLIKRYSALLTSLKEKYYTKKKLEIIKSITPYENSSLIEKIASKSLIGDRFCSNGIIYFGGIPLIQTLSFTDESFVPDKVDRFIKLGYKKLAVVCNSDKKDELLNKYSSKIVLCITENEIYESLGNMEISPPIPQKADIKAVLNRNTAKSWLKLGGILTLCGVVSGKLNLFGGMGLVFMLLSVAINVYCTVKAH